MVLAVILGLVMTWTVESKSVVVGSGDIPSSTEVDYWCTYQKGSVRQGDTATLLLSNIGGIQIQKIEYSVKSNKESGAGTIIVMADDKTLATRSGTFKEWCGTYDAETYHSVTAWTGQQTISSYLCLQLEGTTNSLHINQFVITYQPAPAYSVDLLISNEHYATLTETSGGAGIELPTIDDRENWQFLGWAPHDSWQVNQLPNTWYQAGAHFYPTENSSLWALWQYRENKEPEYVTDLQDGDYLYLNRQDKLAIKGAVSEGKMEHAAMSPDDEQQVYHIAFNATKDSATILHKATGQYIGYTNGSSPKLKDAASKWQVWHGGDSTIFYFVNTQGKKYVLFTSLNSNIDKAGVMKVNDETNAPTVLLSAEQEKTNPVYTGHPECKLGTDFVLSSDNDVVVPFGIYELHVWKEKKYLRLR